MAARHGWRDWAFGLVVICSPTRAFAQSQAEQTFALDYKAAAGCPDGLALVQSIQARTAGAALVTPELAAVRLKVEVEPDGQSRFWIQLGDASFQRDLPSAPCADAVASIAVIVSMVLEAEPASRAYLAAGGAASAPPAKAEFPSPEPEPELEAPTPPPPPPVPPPAKPVERAPTPAKASRRFGVAVTGGAMLETAVAPTPPLGAMLGVEVWWQRSRAIAPGIQAEALATGTATTSNEHGSATFQLLAARLRACLLRIPIATKGRLMPLCAALEGGSLRAQGGGGIANARRTAMPWWNLGAAARAQWDVIPALALEASLSAGALLRKDEFVFRPSSLVYQVPAVSIGAGLGLSLRLH